MPSRVLPIHAPLALTAALLLGGCGGGSPEAPPAAASRLSDALSNLSVLCGDAVIVENGDGPDTEVPVLDRGAARAVDELLAVVRENPRWSYQGLAVADVARTEVSDLTDCSLRSSAARLRSGVR